MYWTPIHSPDRTPDIKNMNFTLWGIIRCSLVGQQEEKKNHICGTYYTDTWEKLQKSLYPGVFEIWIWPKKQETGGGGFRSPSSVVTGRYGSKLNRGILQTKIVHHDTPSSWSPTQINQWPTLRLSIGVVSRNNGFLVPSPVFSHVS